MLKFKRARWSEPLHVEVQEHSSDSSPSTNKRSYRDSHTSESWETEYRVKHADGSTQVWREHSNNWEPPVEPIRPIQPSLKSSARNSMKQLKHSETDESDSSPAIRPMQNGSIKASPPYQNSPAKLGDYYASPRQYRNDRRRRDSSSESPPNYHYHDKQRSHSSPRFSSPRSGHSVSFAEGALIFYNPLYARKYSAGRSHR